MCLVAIAFPFSPSSPFPLRAVPCDSGLRYGRHLPGWGHLEFPSQAPCWAYGVLLPASFWPPAFSHVAEGGATAPVRLPGGKGGVVWECSSSRCCGEATGRPEGLADVWRGAGSQHPCDADE